MKLENIVQKTGVVNDSMTISDGFKMCVSDNVPGIPYVDSNDRVVGCFSISKTLRSTCISEVMVEYADPLGDDTGSLKIAEKHAHKILSLPVDSFVRKGCIESNGRRDES